MTNAAKYVSDKFDGRGGEGELGENGRGRGSREREEGMGGVGRGGREMRREGCFNINLKLEAGINMYCILSQDDGRRTIKWGERDGGTSEGPSSNPRGEWDGCVCSCRGLVAFGSVRGPAGVGYAHPFQVQAL